MGNVDGICRPAGAENYFGLGFYKDAAPDGAGNSCCNISLAWTNELILLRQSAVIALWNIRRR